MFAGKVLRPFFPTVTNESSEASSLQSKQVLLDVIDILQVHLNCYLPMLYLSKY